MISESAWRSILTAPSSSEAVERAAGCSVSTLHQSQVPWKYDELSFTSQANIRAVSRAFDIRIDGVPSDGWRVWAPTIDDTKLCYGWEDENIYLGSNAMEIDETNREHSRDIAETIDSPRAAPISQATVPRLEVSKISHVNSQVIGSDAKTTAFAGTSSAGLEVEKEPTVIEMQSAEAIRNWATHSPHTLPPSEAVAATRKSAAVSKILTAIVSLDDPSTLRATIVGIFSENIGSTFAGQVMKTLIIPYVATLKAPASREMMQAIVKFVEIHWRTVVSLFEGTDNKTNGAVAEVLVRVIAVLNATSAMQSLRAFCKSTWGEDGIRVLESLVGKCKEESDVAGLVVSSIERNILGLESSVRFGKLLFTVARDVPRIAESHGQEMESIISRSKVFLAKRALKVIREKRGQSRA